VRRREFLVEGIRGTAGLSLFSAFGCARPTREQTASASEWRASIDHLENRIPALMKEAVVPGVSIAMVRNGKLDWRRGFGVRDTVSKAPVDTATVFNAASMSKPVFAYAVLQLCDRGMLNLDTPLTRYTPDRFIAGDPRLDLITARHVLSHTSGFQNWREPDEPLAIHFTPGEQFLYSGEGYSYLQSVVTRIYGKPIDEFMRDNVFDSLGMTSSTYLWNRTIEPHLAHPHDAKGAPFATQPPTPASMARYGAAGELWRTPTDYARLLIEVVRQNDSDGQHLKREMLREMTRPHVKTGDALNSWWSLGWQLLPTGNSFVISHGGGNKGWACFSAISEESRSGFVVMTNGDNGNRFIFGAQNAGDAPVSQAVAVRGVAATFPLAARHRVGSRAMPAGVAQPEAAAVGIRDGDALLAMTEEFSSAAYRPGIQELPAATYAFRVEGGFVRIAFGNWGPPVLPPGIRTPVFSHAVTLTNQQALDLSKKLRDALAAPIQADSSSQTLGGPTLTPYCFRAGCLQRERFRLDQLFRRRRRLPDSCCLQRRRRLPEV
jgi:CubicO group peptidase (beta-lactamase class C family)